MNSLSSMSFLFLICLSLQLLSNTSMAQSSSCASEFPDVLPQSVSKQIINRFKASPTAIKNIPNLDRMLNLTDSKNVNFETEIQDIRHFYKSKPTGFWYRFFGYDITENYDVSAFLMTPKYDSLKLRGENVGTTFLLLKSDRFGWILLKGVLVTIADDIGTVPTHARMTLNLNTKNIPLGISMRSLNDEMTGAFLYDPYTIPHIGGHGTLYVDFK